MDKPLPSQIARRLSLRQLQVFEAIARHGSFTRAAEELFLTQPTVSMQVKKLEEAVGLALFEQVGKRMYLTDVGQALRQSARGILETLARFEMEAADLKGLKTGHLRLAVVTTAKYFAPRVLGQFCRRYPGIDVSLKVTNRERLLQRMAQNEDDLYIIGHPPASAELEFEPYLPNPLVVLAPGDHPLAGQRRIAPERIAREPFIMREPGSGTRLAVEQYFARHGLAPRIRMELGSNEAIKQAVLGHLGLSILSRHTLGSLPEGGDLAVLDVVGFPLSWQWYVGYPRGKQLSVIARTFLEYLGEEGREIAGSTVAD